MRAGNLRRMSANTAMPNGTFTRNNMDAKDHPARVPRATAMKILGVKSGRVFGKVVDANPQLVHRVPGEVRAKYLTAELFKLLK